MYQFTSLPPRQLSQPTLLFLLLLSSNNNNNIFTTVNAQQAPNPFYQIKPFTVPSVVENGTEISTFRNNVCHLSERREKIGLTRILEGVALHPVLFINEFTNFNYDYIYMNGETKISNMTLNEEYPGLVPRLMDEFCERAGCTWRDTYAAYPFNILEENDKTFDELLEWSTSAYDVSLDWWMRSVPRLRKGAAYTEKWYDASIILIAKEPDAEDSKKRFDPFSWLYPFNGGVWLLTVGTVFFSAFVYWLLEYLSSNESMDPIEAIWALATSFAGQFEFDPQTPAARLFTFSIAFWALLMGAAYTANLASFLVVKNTPVNPIESLEQAVDARVPMCVVKSSVTDTTVAADFPAYVGSGLLVRKSTQREVFLGLRNGDCEIAITGISSWETFRYDNEVNGDCKLQWIGRVYAYVPASFTFISDAGSRCTSLIRAVFDLHMHNMEREGVIQEFWDGHIEKTASVFCNNDGEDGARRRRLEDGHFRLLKAAQNAAPEAGGNEEFDDTTRLNLSHMGGVFLQHFVLSFLALALGLISRYQRQKDGQAGDSNDETALESAPSALSPMQDKITPGGSVSSPKFDFGSIRGDAAGSHAAVDVLRDEIYVKLSVIEDTLDQILRENSVNVEGCSGGDSREWNDSGGKGARFAEF